MSAETVQPVIQAGSFGVLVWIVWFVFSKGLPSILKTFVETLQKQQESFMKMLTEERDRFFKGLESMQQINIASYRDHRAAMQEQTRELAEALQKNTDALTQLQVHVGTRRPAA